MAYHGLGGETLSPALSVPICFNDFIGRRFYGADSSSLSHVLK